MQICKISRKMKTQRIHNVTDFYLSKNGFYRKQMPKMSDSLFRGITDVAYGSQSFRETLKAKYVEFVNSKKIHRILRGGDKIQALSDCIGYVIRILEEKSEGYEILEFVPGEKTSNLIFFTGCKFCEEDSYHEPKDCSSYQFASSKEEKRIFFFYSEGYRYDPIYSKITIQSLCVCQSIIYEIMYEKVLKVQYSYEASKIILDVKTKWNHPISYNLKSVGSALYFVKSKRLPFSFKVAKSLSVDHYRNIEYDSWAFNQKELAKLAAKQNYLNIQPGTPCWVRTNDLCQDTYGVIESSFNRKLAIVRFETGELKLVPIISLIPILDLYEDDEKDQSISSGIEETNAQVSHWLDMNEYLSSEISNFSVQQMTAFSFSAQQHQQQLTPYQYQILQSHWPIYQQQNYFNYFQPYNYIILSSYINNQIPMIQYPIEYFTTNQHYLCCYY